MSGLPLLTARGAPSALTSLSVSNLATSFFSSLSVNNALDSDARATPGTSRAFLCSCSYRGASPDQSLLVTGEPRHSRKHVRKHVSHPSTGLRRAMTTSSVVLQRDGAYSSRSGKGRIPLHGPRARQDAPAASTPATVRLRHGKQRHLSTSANWASAVSQVGTALPYHESQPDTYQPPVVTEHGHVQTPQSKVTIDPINRLMYSPVLFDPVRVPRNPLVLCHGASNPRFRRCPLLT